MKKHVPNSSRLSIDLSFPYVMFLCSPIWGVWTPKIDMATQPFLGISDKGLS